ncbi:mucin-5AC-like isoform X5 [Cebidichthys violaceus]|uniref:mucin-5AC-like isoform X5 n=2 Tax=Cebidichthys violaceus TaxID=271503 RepID=UPI0035CAFF40
MMAGRLLLVVLVYPFCEMKAEALLPPQLTVSPPVITETDSVTLNCRTPSSVSVTECYFRIVRGGTAKHFPCLQTLTGSELLKMSAQSSPAEVKVTCFYLKEIPSPDSDMSSIIVRTSLPPKLTVNPTAINETDSVTLNCEAPSSASAPRCSFFTSSGGTVRSLSCLQTLTGSELLETSQQRSPAEVQVTCFYTVKLGEKHYPSPHSDTSSITIHNNVETMPTFTTAGVTVRTPHASAPETPETPESPETSDSFHKIQAQDQPKPKLIVNPAVISETETVTLDCQTPSSVPVHQCFFYTVRRGNAKGFTCLQTLTGSELLMMSQKISSATVHVKCYYTVMHGDISTPSPHSDNSSITVQSQKPELSRQHFYREQVVFTCSLPASAHKDTRCNLYFGKASHPVTTTTVLKTRSSTNQWFCQFTVRIDDLLRRLRPLQRRDASCDYSLGSEPNSLSARSDRSSLNDIVESTMTQTEPTSTVTTAGLTVNRLPASTPVTIKQTPDQTVGSSITASFLSTSLTPVKPTSEKITLMIGGGVTVGVVLLGLTLLLSQSRIEKCVSKRPNGLQVDDDETYSIVTYCTNAALVSCSSRPECTKVHSRAVRISAGQQLHLGEASSISPEQCSVQRSKVRLTSKQSLLVLFHFAFFFLFMYNLDVYASYVIIPKTLLT